MIMNFRKKLYQIIFEADTRKGKLFDIVLLVIIILSIFIVLLESMEPVRAKFHRSLIISEWFITFIFTIEYITRLWVTQKPLKYAFSFYGIIDFLSLFPSFLAFFIVGGQSLLVIRAIRLLRVFRVLKLTRYSRAGRLIIGSIWNSREKISVFIAFVLTLSLIIGTLMYLIEGEANGFSSIPKSIYWAIVTLTTVGYGDLSPVTGLGQFLSTIVMILGYSIIAVPTGIVTASLINSRKEINNTQVCSNCMFDKHDDDAKFCKKCGHSLD
jgi:voltage-gated potassium channel